MPLDETFTEIVEHCGRTYQHYSLKNDTYFAPIDEVGAKTLPMSQSSAESNISCQDEISRLEVMHGVLSGLFDRRLIFPPIRSPRRVLDCGCGTGDWAMEVATQYPDSEVRSLRISSGPFLGERLMHAVLKRERSSVPFSPQHPTVENWLMSCHCFCLRGTQDGV